ncbi:hypothetical protein THAOC_04215 [Thalassiosira oceanica]|uniref:Uncharacterized protein n=1 Tax=Thalassiosira oceanica TaxID=159749 RepID=K0TJP6_THAOC|nr:hypothetical protein THAOC_04215 [Thalassiosira oceanica]|eukprot:EJK74126.1 hypothetical protein THAOC_04215 [Thalassiosira oceanica]
MLLRRFELNGQRHTYNGIVPNHGNIVRRGPAKETAWCVPPPRRPRELVAGGRRRRRRRGKAQRQPAPAAEEEDQRPDLEGRRHRQEQREQAAGGGDGDKGTNGKDGGRDREAVKPRGGEEPRRNRPPAGLTPVREARRLTTAFRARGTAPAMASLEEDPPAVDAPGSDTVGCGGGGGESGDNTDAQSASVAESVARLAGRIFSASSASTPRRYSLPRGTRRPRRSRRSCRTASARGRRNWSSVPGDQVQTRGGARRE